MDKDNNEILSNASIGKHIDGSLGEAILKEYMESIGTLTEISISKSDYQRAHESKNGFRIGDRVLIYRTPNENDPEFNWDSDCLVNLFNYGKIEDIDLEGIWISFDRTDDEDPDLYAFPYYVLRKF